MQRFGGFLPGQAFRQHPIQRQRINGKPKPKRGPRAQPQSASPGVAPAIHQQGKLRRLDQVGFQYQAPAAFKTAQPCGVWRRHRKAKGSKAIAQAGAGDAQRQFQPFAKRGAARFKLCLTGQKRCDIRQCHARAIAGDASLEAAQFMSLPASGFGSDVEHDGEGPISRAAHGDDPGVQIQPVHGDGQIHLRFRCQLDLRRGPTGAAIKFYGQVWCNDPVFAGAHAAGDSEGQRGCRQKGRKISARSFKPPLIATFGQQSAARDQRGPLAIQAQFQRADAIIARPA